MSRSRYSNSMSARDSTVPRQYKNRGWSDNDDTDDMTSTSSLCHTGRTEGPGYHSGASVDGGSFFSPPTGSTLLPGTSESQHAQQQQRAPQQERQHSQTDIREYLRKYSLPHKQLLLPTQLSCERCATWRESCEALEAVLERGRQEAAAQESRMHMLQEENQHLKELLASALSTAKDSNANNKNNNNNNISCSSGDVPLHEYQELYKAAERQAGLLAELRQLQTSGQLEALVAYPLQSVPSLPLQWPTTVSTSAITCNKEGDVLLSPLTPQSAPTPTQAAASVPRTTLQCTREPSFFTAVSSDTTSLPGSSRAVTPSRHDSSVRAIKAQRHQAIESHEENSLALSSSLPPKPGPANASGSKQCLVSPPAPPPVQRGGPNHDGSTLMRSTSATAAALNVRPRFEAIIPSKLTREFYVLPQSETLRLSQQQEERWYLCNDSDESTYAVEFHFERGLRSLVPLGDTAVTQEGHLSCTLSPHERKPFLEGCPSPHTVVVRVKEEGSGVVAAAAAILPLSQMVSKHREKEEEEEAQDLPFSTPSTSILMDTSISGRDCVPPPPPPLLTRGEGDTLASQKQHSSLNADMNCITANSSTCLRPPCVSSSSLTFIDDAGLEQRVAETDAHTRVLVEEIATMARMQTHATPTELAAACGRRGFDYVDASFPPVTASLGETNCLCRGYDPGASRSYVVQWCPPSAYLAEQCHGDSRSTRPRLFSGGSSIDPCALKVGVLGNRGLVAGLAALAEATGAVASIVAGTTDMDLANGVVTAWMCCRGAWKAVHVDTYLPFVFAGGSAVPQAPYGCVNLTSQDTWASMCEKAIAKVLGSYRATTVLTAAATVALLTGSPMETWDWWRRSPEEAFTEIEATINTSARGSGIVLLTTRSLLAMHPDLSPSNLNSKDNEQSSDLGGNGQGWHQRSTVEEAMKFFASSGLTPDTSYRVLTATRSVDGRAMVLVRNWQSRSGATPTIVASATSEMNGRGKAVATAVAGAPVIIYEADPCVWLDFTQDVLPHFELCHACFDCRRYHDVRVPIRFVGTDPASPLHLLRVRVRGTMKQQRGNDIFNRGAGLSAVSSSKARLWIGLHQPTCSLQGTPQPLFDLKISLVGVDEQSSRNQRRSLATALMPPAYYLLSESFGGEYQQLPAVWMFLDLETDADVVFYVLAHLRADALGDHGLCFGDEGRSYRTILGASNTESVNGPCRASPSTTAVVALLAERRDAFEVDLLEAPEEMTAALLHNVVDRLDFASCEVVGRSGGGTAGAGHHRMQVNGHWQDTFKW